VSGDDLPECPRCHLAEYWRGDASGRCVKCDWVESAAVEIDPRDAEIARLRAALAAGPAALRDYAKEHRTGVMHRDLAVAVVEAAQKKAMGDT
jgi:translation elongation factor EF-1alpha